MSSASSTQSRDVASGRQRVALAVVLCLWAVYTAMQTMVVLERLPEPVYAIVGVLPGILAVSALLAAGLSREACYLRSARLSWPGLGVLAAVFVFALAAILPFGTWAGWNWVKAFVYAPASGIAQELFFRSALLPAMRAACGRRTGMALVLHPVLFGRWHIGPLFMGTPKAIVAAIMVVPFLSGIGWGWQVNRDGTVVWAMVQHSLIWVIGSPFAFG